MEKLLAFFEIPATDFKRAVNFYEEILGCKLSVKENASEKMAFFPDHAGESPGAISLAPDFKPSGNGVLIHFNVDNVEETLSRIEENGGRIVTPKTKIEGEGMGYFALFTDTEGNRLGLYSGQ